MDSFSGMDYWHEIVKSYDDPESKDPKKKDDGTYSQSSVVILLIYLTFGKDHPYHIAKYFEKSFFGLKRGKEIPYSSNLRTSKVGTLLNKMKEDGLVTVTENKTRVNPMKTYSINPQILQSPIRGGTYFKEDGSIFEIPPETIEGFLGWMALKQLETIDKWQQKQLDEQLRQKRHERTDRIFRALFRSEWVDYFDFLSFIEAEARKWDLQRESSNPQPALNKLILDYIHETDKYGHEWELRHLLYVRGFTDI